MGAYTGDGLALISNNMDFELFSPDMVLKKRFNIPHIPDFSGNPDAFDTYSLAFAVPVFRLHGNVIYFGICSENPSCNYFDQPDVFLSEGCHIASVSFQTDSLQQIAVKGFPRIYHEERDKFSSAWYVNFDINCSDELYVSFEADSLIYECSLSGLPEKAFGNAGRGIDFDYISVHSWNEMDAYAKNRSEKGRYSWLEYIDETGLLFRSYVRGTSSASDGLQIYRKGILIADVDVPKGMRVTGYSAPYYYSQVFEDDADGKHWVMRFMLE